MSCGIKTKVMVTLFLLVEIKSGDGMPQGFFSQGFSIPKFVSNLPNFKVESTVKNSLFNLFGKQNTDNNIEPNDKSKQQLPNAETIGQGTEEFKTRQNILSNVDNGSVITNQVKQPGQGNKDNQDTKLPSVLRDGEELVSKFSPVDENATNNEIGDTEVTTEFATETTTDDYETTTLDLEPLNRSSPQLVASLLG